MSNNVKKSFWSKPEGKTGLIFIIAGLGALTIGMYKLLPYIIVMLENTIYTGILLGIIAFVLFLILNDTSRNLITYTFKGIMKSITSLVIEMDPIKIIKIYVDDLKSKEKDVRVNKDVVGASIKKLEKDMTTNSNEMRKLSNVVQSKRTRGEAEMSISVDIRQIGRLDDSNKRLSVVFNQLTVLHATLDKIEQCSHFMIIDLENEVKTKEIEYKAIKAGNKAIKSAMSIIKGDSRKAMFDEAMEVMADKVSFQVAEIDSLLKDATSFMDAVESDQILLEDAGNEVLDKMLNSIEKKAENIFAIRA